MSLFLLKNSKCGDLHFQGHVRRLECYNTACKVEKGCNTRCLEVGGRVNFLAAQWRLLMLLMLKLILQTVDQKELRKCQ